MWHPMCRSLFPAASLRVWEGSRDVARCPQLQCHMHLALMLLTKTCTMPGRGTSGEGGERRIHEPLGRVESMDRLAG
eukprot:6066944-Amphidinium_carterae.1